MRYLLILVTLCTVGCSSPAVKDANPGDIVAGYHTTDLATGRCIYIRAYGDRTLYYLAKDEVCHITNHTSYLMRYNPDTGLLELKPFAREGKE